MKPIVAITLIISGAMLIAVPGITDHFHERNVVALLSLPGVNQVALNGGGLSELYRFGCWFTGTATIGLAIALSRSPRDRERVSVTAEPVPAGR